jgi:ubiquinone/menaquinone biosynthesis C-methylase UbiE
MPESKFKKRLVEQADIRENHRVLDLGCGTGTLTILIKKTHPNTEVVGLDGDQKVLDIARAKAAKAEVELS